MFLEFLIMPLTNEQRLRELERKIQIEIDRTTLLHRLIKEARREIREIILNGLTKPDEHNEREGKG